VRASINITNFSWPAGRGIGVDLAAIAQQADVSGIDTVFVSDHLIQAEPGTDPTEPMLEAFTALGYLAAHTQRVRLGTMVAAATMRSAAVLVKAVTTLDVLSAGRAWLGIGAGYNQLEADGMGLFLPATAERFERLEDTLRLARQMWAGDDSAFTGRRVNASRPIGRPLPTTSPHPPILIGGTGETKTLRLVARYADACNLPDVPDGGALIRHKLAVLAAHCAAAGRNFDDIDKTVSTRLSTGESADDFVERARRLAAIGVDHLVVITQGPWTTETLTVLAEAIPAISNLSTTSPATEDHESNRSNQGAMT
jgi:F420-dependent oxidoreductase-like protein